MKVAGLLTVAAIAQVAYGHAYVWGVSINGQDQGRGDAVPGYIRKIANNDPIKNVASPDMTCNRNSGPNSKSLSMKGGDKVTVEWAHNNRGDDIIASSHKGPVQVYIAPTASNGKGNVWVKIAMEGYSGGQWATDKLIANKGKHSFTLPNIAAGDYLIRPEIIALHEGSNVGGAQLYMACIQVKVAGSGATLPSGIAIPGAYSATDPGIKFNVYNKPIASYPIPGGPVIRIGGGSKSNSVMPESEAAAPAPEAAAAAAAPALEGVDQIVGSAQGGHQANAAMAGGAVAAKWAQCGGKTFNGPTACAEGSSCKEINEWYSQCA